jgi:uroporphyrinogen decarboxylase-like protein
MSFKMTSRERMLAAMRCEEHDHVPFSPYIYQNSWGKKEFHWRNQVERTEKMLGLGLDPFFNIWLPDYEPSSDVEIKTWREKKGDEILTTKEFHTPAGVLRQVIREDEEWCGARHGTWIPKTWGGVDRDHFGMDLFDDYNISRRLEPWVKDSSDLEKLKYLIRIPQGYKLDEWRMDAQRAMEYADRFEVVSLATRTIIGDAYQWFCDIPWFMMQLYDDPEFVRDFFAIFQDWALDQVDLAMEIGVDVFQYRGWYETPPFWSPENWKEYLLPGLEKQVEKVHAVEKLLTYNLPEGQGAFIDVLSESNVDILQGMDPKMLHSKNVGGLEEIFEKHGSSKSFWGGVNAEVTLESQDYKRIKEEVSQAVEVLNQNNGLVLSAYIFQEVPHEGVMRFIEAWKKTCGQN